jgi:crystallin alpha B
MSKIVNDKHHFKVNLDVHQFKPEEITVKTIENYVIIEGRHQEKEDEHGYIQRHFVRKYLLPEGVKPEAVTSTLSADGVLTIHAPKQPQIEAGGERIVPIAHVPYPAIHHAVGKAHAAAVAAAHNGGDAAAAHSPKDDKAKQNGEKMDV